MGLLFHIFFIFSVLFGRGYSDASQTADTSCLYGQFKCQNGKCLDHRQVCNYWNDCENGEDEKGCGSCDFENDLCKYNIENDYYYQSELVKAGSTDDSRIPLYDHTFPLRSDGHFVQVKKIPTRETHSYAILASPYLRSTSFSCQLTFAYFKGNKTCENLNVTIEKPNELYTPDWTPIWTSLSSSESLKWVDVKIGVKELTPNSRVSVQAKPSDDCVIFIDDIKFRNCKDGFQYENTQALKCNFKGGDLCIYQNDYENDDMDWIARDSLSDTLITNTNSTYMYMYSTNEERQRAVLFSGIIPAISYDSAQCLQFSYYSFGTNHAAIKLYISQGGIHEMFWLALDSHVQGWRQAQVPLKSKSAFHIEIEGSIVPGVIVAITNIDVIPSCPWFSLCTFENGFCGYKNDLNGQFNWTHSEEWSLSGVTGPKFDHSTMSEWGNSVWITSAGHRAGDKARIASPTFAVPNGKTYCLSYWYQLKAKDLVGFRVFVRDSANREFELLTDHDESASEWDQQRLPLTISSQTLSIVFEASIVKAGNGSFVALDDIKIDSTACLKVGSCTFESDMCGYYSPPVSGYTAGYSSQWLRTRSTDFNSDFLEESQHGYYLLANADKQSEGNKAWLYSSFLPSSSVEKCFIFSYYMYGEHVGNLSLYFIVGSSAQKVWNATGAQGNHWNIAYVTLPKSVHDYQVGFLAEGTKEMDSDIAIDDFILQDQCPMTATADNRSTSAAIIISTVAVVLVLIVVTAIIVLYITDSLPNRLKRLFQRQDRPIDNARMVLEMGPTDSI